MKTYGRFVVYRKHQLVHRSIGEERAHPSLEGSNLIAERDDGGGEDMTMCHGFVFSSSI